MASGHSREEKRLMCPVYYSFLNQCVVKGQPPYSPFMEEKIVYCLGEEYHACERYRLFFEDSGYTAMDRRTSKRVLKQYSGVMVGPEKKSYIETVDISKGGMRVKSTAYIPEGRPVSIIIEDHKGNKVDLSGWVRWTSPQEEDGKWTMGIQFTHLLDPDRLCYLYERQVA